MDKTSRDEMREPASGEAAVPPAPSRAGRRRQWPDAAAKHRAYRERQVECHTLLAELLVAVRDASLEGADLRQAAVDGDDAALLRALIRHYQARHWCRPRKEEPD